MSGNAAGQFTSRAITSDSKEGKTEVDYKMWDVNGSPLVKQVALANPIPLPPDKSVSHLPAFTASELPIDASAVEVARPRPTLKMPHVTYSDNRFQRCHTAMLSLVQWASDSGKNSIPLTSDERYQLLVGGMQLVARDVFLPKAAVNAQLFPLDGRLKQFKSTLLGMITAGMEGNMSPAAMRRQVEKELAACRGPIIQLGKQRQLLLKDAGGGVAAGSGVEAPPFPAAFVALPDGAGQNPPPAPVDDVPAPAPADADGPLNAAPAAVAQPPRPSDLAMRAAYTEEEQALRGKWQSLRQQLQDIVGHIERLALSGRSKA